MTDPAFNMNDRLFISKEPPARRIASRVPLYGSVVTTGLSMLAAGLVSISLPWALISAGQGASLAGLASFALQIPVALGLLLGGGLVERVGPRRILILSNLGALALVMAAAALAWLHPDRMLPLVALLAVANLVGQPGTVAQDARVPELARLAGVPLERANGLRDIAVNLGLVGGPALGVLLVDLAGVPLALGLAAVLLGIIALVDALLFPAFAGKRRAADGRTGRPTGILADPLLRIVAIIGVMLVAVFAALDEILVPALVVSAGLDGTRLALFLGLAAVAAMSASGLYSAIGHRLPARRVFVGGVLVMAVGAVLLASLPVAVGLIVAPVLIGLGVGPIWPLIVTAIQRRVAAADRGRLIASLSAVILLAQPFAALAAGPAVDALGTAIMTSAVAALVILAALIALFARGLGDLDDRPASLSRSSSAVEG